MTFVDSISELEYYNPSIFGCYSDGIYQPGDIMLQANGFIATDVTVTINVCNTAGEFQEDATVFFKWNFRSIVIAGITYYYVNITANTFAAFMVTARCFVLNVVITDTATGVVFDKFTQKYLIVTETAAVIPPSIYLDNGSDSVSLQLCIPASNPA